MQLRTIYRDLRAEGLDPIMAVIVAPIVAVLAIELSAKIEEVQAENQRRDEDG